jgi:hypothetical protein
MRNLTVSEAIVVRSLLAREPGHKQDQIRISGIPKRTFQDIRSRAFAEGWVRDRYVPNTVHFGFPIATFCVSQPFIEHRGTVSRLWGDHPANAVLWVGSETIFAVFLHNRLAEFSSPTNEGIFSPPLFRENFTLTVDLRDPSVPAYFDFEGAWVRLMGLSGTLTYPQSPPGSGCGRISVDEARVVTADRRAVIDLLGRSPEAGHHRGPFYLPRHLQRLVSTGQVDYRVFPDFKRIPESAANRADGIAFVRGRLSPGCRPQALFQELAQGSGVNPFLYVTDGKQVLLASVLATSFRTDLRRDVERIPVTSTLGRFLMDVGINRERLDTLANQVDHRYSRIFEQYQPG